MLVANSGPHVVEHLQKRVASLSEALDAAQARIDELERAFGSDAEIMPLVALGLTRSEARIVWLIYRRDIATTRQLMHAVYVDSPDRMHEIEPNTIKTFVCFARKKLRRLGLTVDTVGYGDEASGYRMPGADKARLSKLIASGAHLVTRGRPDRKYYKRTPLPQCEQRL